MPLKTGLHNTLGGIIRAAVQALTIPILIRLISVEQYGLWSLVAAILGVIALVEGGLTVSTTVFAARDLAQKDSCGLGQTFAFTLGAMSLLATLAAAVLWFGADAGTASGLFANLTPEDRAAVAVTIRMSAVVVWLRLMQQVFIGIEQGFQRYGLLNLITTTQQVVTSIGMLLVAHFGGRIVALMQWQALSGMLAFLVHALVVWRLLRPLRPQFSWNSDRAREIAGFGLLAWMSALGSALFTQCDRLIVGRILGTEALGLYAAMLNVTFQINAISAMSAQPLVPALANALGTDAAKLGNLRPHLRKAVELNALLALGMGTGLCLLAPWGLRILLPASQSGSCLREFEVASVIYALYSVNAVGYYVLYGLQDMKHCVLVQIATGFLSLSLIAVGAWWGGLFGAVLGGSGYLGTTFLNVTAMRRLEVEAREWFGWLTPYLLCFAAAVVAAGLLGATSPLRWVSAIAISAAMGWLFLLRQGLLHRGVVDRIASR